MFGGVCGPHRKSVLNGLHYFRGVAGRFLGESSQRDISCLILHKLDRTAGIEQILAFPPIYLEERDLDFRDRQFFFLYFFEEVFHSPLLDTHHGVGLPRSGLAVGQKGEDTSV